MKRSLESIISKHISNSYFYAKFGDYAADISGQSKIQSIKRHSSLIETLKPL